MNIAGKWVREWRVIIVLKTADGLHTADMHDFYELRYVLEYVKRWVTHYPESAVVKIYPLQDCRRYYQLLNS